MEAAVSLPGSSSFFIFEKEGRNIMRHSVFSTSIKILIVTLILLAVCFNREVSQYLMIGAASLWLVILIGCLLSKKLCRLVGALAHSTRRTVQAFYRQRQESAEERASYAPESAKPEPVQEAATIEPEKQTPGLTSEDQETMLRHIALRITEKLKSAYPDATWVWQDKPELKAVLNGQTVRIITDGIENNTHADISFDRYARVHINMLVVEEFAAKTAEQPEASVPETEKVPDVVDVRVWYDLIGRNILETLVTDLNANGHTRLTIKENGDIVIIRNKKEEVKTHLENFPAKNYWNELINIFKENELKAVARKDGLGISWV